MLKWLFFDVGGTLLDEEPVYRFQEEMILEIINSHGLAVSEKEFASAVRAARRYYLPSYVSHLLWIFTEDAEKFQDVSLDYERRINKVSYKKYRELLRVLPGVKDLLAELGRRYNLGIIGNQPAVVRRCLGDEGLIDLFQVHAISAEMGMRKPDLRFFLGALSMAKCPPDGAAMIGDRLDNDIFPARMLGMTTVRLKFGPHRHQPVLSPEYLPHYTVTSIHSLSRLLLNDEFVSKARGGELVW